MKNIHSKCFFLFTLEVNEIFVQFRILKFVSKRPVSKSRRVLRRRLDANCSIYIHEHKMRLSVIVSLLKKTVSFICHLRWEHSWWQVVATRRGDTLINCFVRTGEFLCKSLSPRHDLSSRQVAWTHLKWSDFLRRLEGTNPAVEAKSCTRILPYTRSDLSLRRVDLLLDLYTESDLSPWLFAATCRLVSRPLFGRFTFYFSRIDDTTIFSYSDFWIVSFSFSLFLVCTRYEGIQGDIRWAPLQTVN